MKMVTEAEKGKTDKLTRGTWSAEEDKKLKNYIMVNHHGKWKWRDIPNLAGLNRCHRSCRLRWMNYLRPGFIKGNITQEEENLIMRLHNLLGNRWALISKRLPGRTDNEIKNFWFTHLRRRALSIRELNDKQNEQRINHPHMNHWTDTTNKISSLPCEEYKEHGISGLLNEEFAFESVADLQGFLEI